MAFVKSQGRERWLQAFKIGEMPSYEELGWGVTESNQDFESDEEELKFINMRTAISENNGYKVTQGVEMMAYTDNPLFGPLDDIRRVRGVGSISKGKILDNYLYKSEEKFPTTVEADESDISITITSFGEVNGKLGIGYIINYNSDPVAGTTTIDYDTKSFTFTAGTGE